MKTNNKVMKFIVKYIENHLWFVERSKTYSKGIGRLEYYTRYPIAYVRYMYHAMNWDRKETVLRNTKRNNDSHSSNKST
jgi:hypothetical protein